MLKSNRLRHPSFLGMPRVRDRNVFSVYFYSYPLLLSADALFIRKHNPDFRGISPVLEQDRISSV